MIFQPHRLRLHCHVTCESKKVFSTWRSVSVWHQSMARESIRRHPLSYSYSMYKGTTYTDRTSSAAFQVNTSKQSSEEASSWHATVLPSPRFASKNVIFSPWNANLTSGTPPKNFLCFYKFLPVDPPRNMIGLVLGSNWAGFVVKTWQPLHATCRNVWKRIYEHT